jgi:hypothetical protein
MNDRRNSLPQDVLSFGPFSVFAAERLLKKADEPITLLTPWLGRLLPRRSTGPTTVKAMSSPRLPVNDRQSHVMKKRPGTCRGFFQPPEAIDLLPIDKTEVHTK